MTQTTAVQPRTLVRMHQVEERVSLKKSTIYAMVQKGDFPSPVRLSARAVAFRSEEIEAWIASREATGSAAK